MATTITDMALLRLLQLGSPSLPVGGFSFSQGLEYATETGWIKNRNDTYDWLNLQLHQSLARLDLAVILRLYPLMESNDIEAICYWNQFLLASRETSELYLTDNAMGAALNKLLPSLGIDFQLPPGEQPSFVTLFTAAAYHWQIDAHNCALGLAWSWLENQLAAATKLVPLGQTQAQQLLGELQQQIPVAINLAQSLDDNELGGGLPALAIGSALHETQYSRLFRS